ncbi:hypothetical protein [Saccharothrix sp. NRRL B-16348]|uniref:hypothetical protein n=1 Tax=Saccharothrix sp. NRRL B-16348 TaxID=1415542 RepID=UPI0012F76896|nr:hypothetical protein [Saccharothrix sp. NRRL B-16348]
MSVEAVIALVTLAVGVPQEVVVTDLAMSVPPPGCGASAGVDVHLDAPERACRARRRAGKRT